ncbi:MAG: hypothetical protein K2L13_01690 [Opitutales bacterium]|nr:hypothetical protein [Opitutales bacterium]
MKQLQNLRLYRSIAIIAGFVVLAVFLIKFHNVWKIPVEESAPQPKQENIDLDDLLSFNDQHQIWEPIAEAEDLAANTPLFDLFTPPNIYYEGSQLIMEPCSQWQFDTTFPLRLKNIKQKKYRLQFEGYIKPDPQSKYVIILHDLEHDQVLRCEEGQSFDSLQFAILSFSMKTIEEDGMIINSPRVQIFDSQNKQKIELTGNTKYYDDRYDVVLENIDGATYILPEIGQEVKIGESTCILNKIEPASKSVTITLIDANNQKFHKHLRML